MSCVFLLMEEARHLLGLIFSKKKKKKPPSSDNTREDSTHEHHQMINTEITLITFFSAKDGEALYSQQKQHQELTVAKISSVSSIAQLFPTLCDAMDCSMPGLLAHHQLPEFTQIHVH